MAKTVDAWDDPDFAKGIRTPPDHQNVEFKIGDRVHVTFDLTEAHLQELIGHNAGWIKLGQPVAPPEVLTAVRGRRAVMGGFPAGSAEGRAWRREVRHFADGIGRGRDLLRPGWKPGDGSKNKYLAQPPQDILDAYAAWVAVGRPPLASWAQAS